MSARALASIRSLPRAPSRPPVDTFAEATGEEKARRFDVYGYAFLALRP
jgi:hypothetical protein